MTQFEKVVLYGLATLYQEQTGLAIDEILADWQAQAESKWPTQKTITSDEDADVLEVYNAYPSRDANNGNRPTGKGQKDKQHIRNLLAKGKYTKEQLLALIRQEVDTREETGAYLRNFSTFLNNMPDLEEGDLF